VDTLEAGTEGKATEGEATEEQVIALLKKFGPPEKVAASYWPEGQYLIGPRLYPLFRMVTGIALGVFVIVQLALNGILVVFEGRPLPTLEVFGSLAGGLFIAFGTIVLVFAVLQRLDVRPDGEYEEWDPRELPEFDVESPISRGGTVIEITLSLILIAVLLVLPDQIGVVIHPAARAFLNPVILRYLPLIIVSILLGIGLDVILLWRERWETWMHLAKVVLNLFSIYVLSVLLAGHTAWLAERGVTGLFAALEMLPQVADPSGNGFQIFVMQVFRLAFIVALIVTILEAASMVYRMVRRLIVNPSSRMTWAAKR
jgi:hypothetical protein